jgi:hypothetical protein
MSITLLQRNIVGPSGATHTGVVADDVYLAERLDGHMRRALNGGVVTHIAYHAADFGQIAFESLHDLFQWLRLDISEHHAHARLGEGSAHG